MQRSAAGSGRISLPCAAGELQHRCGAPSLACQLAVPLSALCLVPTSATRKRAQPVCSADRRSKWIHSSHSGKIRNSASSNLISHEQQPSSNVFQGCPFMRHEGPSCPFMPSFMTFCRICTLNQQKRSESVSSRDTTERRQNESIRGWAATA